MSKRLPLRKTIEYAIYERDQYGDMVNMDHLSNKKAAQKEFNKMKEGNVSLDKKTHTIELSRNIRTGNEDAGIIGEHEKILECFNIKIKSSCATGQEEDW